MEEWKSACVVEFDVYRNEEEVACREDNVVRDIGVMVPSHSNLAEPESTSPVFMLKYLIIWSLLEGVKVVIHQSLALL